MVDQRRRHWGDVVQMLYKCFVFAGNSSWSGIAYCWRQADTDSMSVKCWVTGSDTGQYPLSSSQYIKLPVPACWWYGHDALNQSWVKTRNGNPILGDCLLSVVDCEPTLAQHWVNLSCLTACTIESADRNEWDRKHRQSEQR